ncbi:MoxR family ATPase [uncultured Ilyobacter sp.]|uniref:AAA family ATPase n=1 Tax=uncultured Ilyobacter sp. TaxID=544433 RepID=UPI0029F4704D|nr:MoxR family ATPase [uncultured Ilyobacter sp.]
MEKVQKAVDEKKTLITNLKNEISKVVIGQEDMINKTLIGIFTGGHILLEGVPGLAKSLTVNTLSKVFGLSFSRIQFTPDLLPSDIIGTEIYHEKTGEFKTKIGPVFRNFILADEINRAPAKVQSALLESMQEKQVTISDTTYKLDNPFLVIATQNPLEQDGTYPLPEAQQDRFMMKLNIGYPKKSEERQILEMTIKNQEPENTELNAIITKEQVFEIKELIHNIYLDDRLKEYILDIIFKTREANPYIECGASPRAGINLIKAAKAKAFLDGRAYVMPDDIRDVVYDILRHRLILTYEAEAENLKVEQIIAKLLDEIVLP